MIDLAFKIVWKSRQARSAKIKGGAYFELIDKTTMFSLTLKRPQ
jgi:hypothetical protein